MMVLKDQGTFIEWAQQALSQYPIEDYALCFLGHSDNLTFRVTGPDGINSLLRLHTPVVQYLEGIRQLPEVIASELTWMEVLRLEGGFPVQQPFHTRDGSWVAVIEGEEGEIIPCTLLSWLEGDHFLPAAPDAAKQVQRFGSLAARMHEFSVHWSPPAGFIRPQYDRDHFQRIFARLLRGADFGIFSEDIYRTLRAVGQSILSEIEALPSGSGDWGMIHADLHVGNFLVNGEQIVPIDFSFCGFGHYWFDVSVCLAGGLRADLRPAFLEGYRAVRPLPEADLRVIEAYALAGRLSYYAYQMDNPTERSWLTSRIPQVAAGECARFLSHESFLFDM